MPTITKRTNSSGTYYYLVSSARANGKSRIVQQTYLGTAERLGVCRVIDEAAGKRKQGLPVSSPILLAAINRAVAPVSKKSFFEWFDKTVLYKMFPAANEKNLSS